jgi:topoisomerase-4 subunit A
MREVTRDDLVKLTEIKIKRISKYDTKKADEHIKSLEKEMEDIRKKLAGLTQYTIQYFNRIKKKFGKGRERKTEIRNLETIEATKVVEANEKLYVQRKEGFIGTGLKKAEYVCNCSDIDEVIVIRRDGSYIITKVDEKLFVGNDILHVKVFKRNDERTIYNTIYRDGLNGNIMMKRCPITGITRDREYDLTKGTKGSRILYLTVNPNGEAEKLKVYLQPKPRLKKKMLDLDFGELAIKGRNAQGNILTRHAVHKIVLQEKGESTLGGKPIWFDEEVLRLNTDEKGKYLGEFSGDDKIVVITNQGTVKFTSYDLMNHYEDNIRLIEKFDGNKVYSAVYFDAEQGYYYVKRFRLEYTTRETSLIGDHEESRLIYLFEDKYPRVKLQFGGRNKRKEDQEILLSEFIGEKSYKARGKRLTQAELKNIKVLEPLPEEEDDEEEKDQMSLEF